MSQDAPHSQAFRLRRFFNWFPLGLTYAALYMGRYNFNVVKGDIGTQFGLSKEDTGLIGLVAFWTYALAVMFNGPLADRFGGKRAILVGATGALVMNGIIGALFLTGWTTNILVGLCVLYAANMYFQSFGALSVVKVNAAWFRVKERGVFGGIFGVMISSGYWLALTVGGWVKAAFGWQMVFLAPVLLLGLMIVVDVLLVRDRPGEAGHADFDTGDATSGDDSPVNLAFIVQQVLKNPILLTIAAAEFCTGFVRQGVLFYFVEFLSEVHGVKAGTSTFTWAGNGVTIGGILGGLLAGFLSDRIFQSRRPPVAVLFYVVQVGALLMLGYAHTPEFAAFCVGFTCMWVFGVHGMLSGTASMDFGGKKAAATAAGMLDGIQYVASGITTYWIGWVLEHYGWDGAGGGEGAHPVNAPIWVASIIPFSILGGLIMMRLWNAKPSGRGGH